MNRGRPVFRLRESRLLAYSLFDAVILGGLGLIVSAAAWQAWIGAVPFALVGLAHGVRRGLRSRRDECSDHACRIELPPSATRCPGCGGEIMGTIVHEDQRLEMEDKCREEAARRAGNPAATDEG